MDYITAKILKKNNIIFVVVLFLHQLLQNFIQSNLSPIHYAKVGLFFSELLTNSLFIPPWLLTIIEIGNLFLLWLISKIIFPKYSIIVPIIYVISPWSSYLLVAGSFYIYILFLLLLGVYGLILLKSSEHLAFRRKILGNIVISGALLVIAYSSLTLLLVMPLFLLLPYFKIVSFRNLKLSFVIITILFLPLLFLVQRNTIGFKNVLNNEIKIFSNPGLLNMVNSYRGAAQEEGFGKLAQISENKYIVYTEYILLKYIKQFSPSSYFTSEEKLLNFSFAPPILLGFIIPLVYSLYKLLRSPRRKLLFLSTILVIPAVLSERMVDLNRLIIFAPVIMILISHGVIELLKQKREKIIYFFLMLTLVLVTLQSFVVLFDIQLREKARFSKYYEYEKNYEVGKQ